MFLCFLNMIVFEGFFYFCNGYNNDIYDFDILFLLKKNKVKFIEN